MSENTPTPAELARDARLELEGWEEAQGDYDARDWAKLGQLLTGLTDALEAVTSDRDSAYAAIDEAPHEDLCTDGFPSTKLQRVLSCSCWKSTALATVRALPDRETVARTFYEARRMGPWGWQSVVTQQVYLRAADAVLALFGQEGRDV